MTESSSDPSSSCSSSSSNIARRRSALFSCVGPVASFGAPCTPLSCPLLLLRGEVFGDLVALVIFGKPTRDVLDDPTLAELGELDSACPLAPDRVPDPFRPLPLGESGTSPAAMSDWSSSSTRLSGETRFKQFCMILIPLPR